MPEHGKTPVFGLKSGIFSDGHRREFQGKGVGQTTGMDTVEKLTLYCLEGFALRVRIPKTIAEPSRAVPFVR